MSVYLNKSGTRRNSPSSVFTLSCQPVPEFQKLHNREQGIVVSDVHRQTRGGIQDAGQVQETACPYDRFLSLRYTHGRSDPGITIRRQWLQIRAGILLHNQRIGRLVLSFSLNIYIPGIFRSH